MLYYRPALDHRTVFYVKREEGTLRAHQVWRHTLGETEDTLVFEETDEQFYVSVGRSRSRDYILIGSYQTVSSEYRFVDARQPTAAPQLFLERERDHEYDVDHLGGRFYVRTNWEAQDFRLMSAAPADTGHKDRWREEIPAREGVLFRGFELFRDYLVASERVDGIAGLRVLPWGEEGRADAERVQLQDLAGEILVQAELPALGGAGIGAGGLVLVQVDQHRRMPDHGLEHVRETIAFPRMLYRMHP